MQISKKEYLAGITYFSGWWDGENNGWHSWLPKYPERTPLLGQFQSQETMDKEIIAASDYGVDFFQILWYPCYSPATAAPHNKHLGEGVRFFMASPENNRMSFSVEYCNHPPFAVTEENHWKEACAEVVSYMKHPSYLRVGGKTIFKIHSIRAFLTDCGNDIQTAVSWIQYLCELARKEGVGDLLLGAGSWVLDDFSGIPELMAQFDFIQFYMGFPDNPQEEEYSYEYLMEFALNEAKRCAANVPLPYLPFIPSGWNPRPWAETGNTYFNLPDKAQWKKCLSEVKELLDTNIKYRIPDGTTEGQKMFNIYAWNEYGEGGIISPTTGDGYMKLEGIAEVFK